MKFFRLLCGLLLMLLTAHISAQPSVSEQLNRAIKNTDVDAVRALLKSGAPVTALDNSGFPPLVTAVIVSSNNDNISEGLKVIRLLLDAGADIEQQGMVGNSPLLVACNFGYHLEIVTLLLDRGAKVNARGYNGTFPLYQAVRKNHPAIVNVLVEHGADVKAGNADGETPLHYAALNGMESTVGLLLANGADINARDNEGKTPLSWAMGKTPTSFLSTGSPLPEMIDMLKKRGGTE
ncbi:ankyrin repeat domain-containing protein [Duganella qianjiadongensis]|uniref:Ankyrin repeat domain-containing protein n=1 Tax=Duganella qianjiadongensis TaxID=2692176 RepID=A0ABW9VL61_9BURK|nr:ankyrin repeat domain-containing protein [Duganella qianjiadongensis]MYM39442.1 hypothetical protein [Duganella qianjiadongensis]